MKKLIFIDTETTGLDPVKNSLWQIGIVYRNESGQVYSLNFKCKPLNMENITDEALQVCNTSREELEKLPDPKEVKNQFIEFLLSCINGGEKLTWVGYNSRFDQGFIDVFLKHFDPQDSIWNYFYRHHVDMLEYVRLLKSMELFNPETLKLGSLYQMFGIDETTAHDAVQDSYVTYLTYQWAEDIIKKGFIYNQKLLEGNNGNQ